MKSCTARSRTCANLPAESAIAAACRLSAQSVCAALNAAQLCPAARSLCRFFTIHGPAAACAARAAGPRPCTIRQQASRRAGLPSCAARGHRAGARGITAMTRPATGCAGSAQRRSRAAAGPLPPKPRLFCRGRLQHFLHSRPAGWSPCSAARGCSLPCWRQAAWARCSWTIRRNSAWACAPSGPCGLRGCAACSAWGAAGSAAQLSVRPRGPGHRACGNQLP